MSCLSPGSDLRSVAEKVPQSQRWTDWYDKNKTCQQEDEDLSSIDHILVSAGLYEKVTGAFMQHSYKEYCGTMDSDHWPVVVDFEGF